MGPLLRGRQEASVLAAGDEGEPRVGLRLAVDQALGQAGDFAGRDKMPGRRTAAHLLEERGRAEPPLACAPLVRIVGEGRVMPENIAADPVEEVGRTADVAVTAAPPDG